MPAFPRTILPVEASELDLPGPLISKSQAGRVNIRATQQTGRTWTERYLLKVSNVADRAFLATVRSYWRNGTTFDLSHVDYQTVKGVGGGAALVQGASQTGSNLVVDAAPLSTTAWLRAGDIFRVAGLPQVLEASADVNTNGSGVATIPMVVPIFTGGSPADNAALTITGVVLTACIVAPPEFPSTSGTGADWGTLNLQFSEVL